ncbi:hypothetical protein CPB84DRAFT_1844276 [Gymnopilus junonius]|uniref:Uncharacterized protein n=1 Tax=Gymnopilus junonius TaxID=109634 RepID=A0A9P5NVN3_GYMJU|nr:hypothetical protein CPB84DRAFT_1844276 [Gymnopilus junonius]
MQSHKDHSEDEAPPHQNAPDSLVSGHTHSCAILSNESTEFLTRRQPPLLWRKSTYYGISLISLFLATVLAIVAFSIRTSYRGGAFLDKDHLPVLFYAAAVFIGALPLSGVCALLRYEKDVAIGWVLFFTLVFSLLSLGPIFIFSIDSAENTVFIEDHTSATLAYVMATFCVISSIALCVAAGITYLTMIRIQSNDRSRIKDIFASVTLSIASLGAFSSAQSELKRRSKWVGNAPSSAMGAPGLDTTCDLASLSMSRKSEGLEEFPSPV